MNKHQKQSQKIRPASDNTKTLIKQSSSPLISRVEFTGDIYQKLTYARRKPMNPQAQTQKYKQNIKQKRQYINRKTKKVPIPVKLKNYQLQKKVLVQSMPFLQSLLKKSKIQPIQKQRKHFGFMYESHVLDGKNGQQKICQNGKIVSPSKHRKLMEDFSHHSDFNGNIFNNLSKYQSHTHQSKKRQNYRLNMQKQSFQLETQYYIRPTMKKPYLKRTFSSIQLS